MPPINRADLSSTLERELRSAWDTLRRSHPNDHFYSFGVYTTEEVDYLMVTASTEEGLSAATKVYVQRDGGDPSLVEASLRWSPCDSPVHQEGEALLAESEGLRGAALDADEDSADSERDIEMVFDVVVETLRELDGKGVFGADIERTRLVLGVWMGDQSDEERIEFARRLNRESVAKRFAREFASGTQAFFKLHPR